LADAVVVDTVKIKTRYGWLGFPAVLMLLSAAIDAAPLRLPPDAEINRSTAVATTPDSRSV